MPLHCFPPPNRCLFNFRKYKRVLQFGAKPTFVRSFYSNSSHVRNYRIQQEIEYQWYECVSIESNMYVARSQADIPVCRSSQVDVRKIFSKLIGNCGIGDEQRAFVE